MFFAIRKPVREAERAQPQRTAPFENPSVRRPSPLRMHDRVRSAGTDRGLSKCRFSFTNKLYYITNRNTLQVKSLIFSVPAQAGGAAVSRHARTGASLPERDQERMFLQRQVFDPEPPVLHLERNSEAVSGDEVDRRRKPGEPLPSSDLERDRAIVELASVRLHRPDRKHPGSRGAAGSENA